MIFISLAATTICFLVMRAKNNLLADPYTMFFLIWLYYTYYCPVVMAISGEHSIAELDVFLSDDDIVTLSVAYFASFVIFSLTYKFIFLLFDKQKIEQLASYRGEIAIHRQSRFLWTSVLLIALAIATFFWSEFASLNSNYEEKIGVSYSTSNFSAAWHFWQCLLGITLLHTISMSKRTMLVLVLSLASLIFLAAVTFSKFPLVIGLVAVLFTLSKKAPKYEMLILCGTIVGILFALFTIIPIFAAYRATGTIALSALEGLNAQQILSDARGPLATYLLALKYSNVTDIPPFLTSWTLWIPRSIWPSRPFDLAEAFAQANMKNRQPGFGLGMSPLTEGTLRFNE